MKKSRGLTYIIAAVSLIVVAIITTAIIGAVKNNQAPADIRAKAGVSNTLKLTGIVNAVNEADGTITVDGVQFSQDSRSGPAHNYGTWTVTPPLSFSILTAQPGKSIMFTVETTSFNVATKQVAATQMSVEK